MPRVKRTGICIVDECDEPWLALDKCDRHYHQDYYLATKVRDREKRRAHYLANAAVYKDRARTQGAISRRAQPDKYAEKNRRYRTLKPEQHRASQLRRRARKADADVRWFSENDWQSLCRRFSHCCAYCGQPKPLTQDHVIPLSRGGRHAIGNLLPACFSCNASKGTKFLVEWRRYRHVIRQLT